MLVNTCCLKKHDSFYIIPEKETAVKAFFSPAEQKNAEPPAFYSKKVAAVSTSSTPAAQPATTAAPRSVRGESSRRVSGHTR